MALTSKLISRLGASRQAARDIIAALPPYQVALWPDGWQLGVDGSVRVCDTHAMAEARRWFALIDRRERGGPRAASPQRAMQLHGIFVPRAIVDVSGRIFPSEQVASVALQLIAADWVKQRRRTLLDAPERALADHHRAWSGSRHAGSPEPEATCDLLQSLLDQCIDEGLLPRARYRLGARSDDGYGVRLCRCSVEVDLDPYARARIEEALNAALIPWNRAVIRDGTPVPVIALSVRPRGSRRSGG